MSVIQRIRDKGAWIIFSIIALALIAFILQDGLGRRGSFFSNTTTLGKINGKTIERVDFEKKLELYGRGQSREQLIGQIWNQEVNTAIMEQEYQKLGLVCTGKELGDILFGENSPLRREFTDQKTGIFKAEEARQAFAQLKKSKNQEQLGQIYQAYLEPSIQQALQGKYQNLLQQSAYAPKWMIQKQKADNSLTSSIAYVYVPYSTVVDSTIKVTDDEITAFGRKHIKEYQKEEETRAISFVSFDVSPSTNDSNNVKTQLETLRTDFSTATDLKSYFARVSSETPFYDSYNSKNEIKSAVKDTLFKLKPGSIYGPYLEGNNYVLAKVVDVKQWPDSSKVRHILVSTHQQDPNNGSLMRIREDTAARKRMDTVEALLKKGAKFDSVCAAYSDDGNKDKGGVYDFFVTSKMVPSFNDFSFGKPVGSTGVIQTDYGYHYVEVLGQKGSNAAYKIGYLAKPIAVSSETVNIQSTAAAEFASSVKNKKQFEDKALSINKVAIPAGDIKENDASVQGVGQSRQLVKWIYDHSTGDVSEQPLDLNNKFVVSIVTAVNKPGLPSAQTLRPQVENLVKSEKKAKQIIETKFKGNTLEAFTTSSGSAIQKADSLLFSNPFVPGVGNEPILIGLAFNKDLKGKVTDPIAGTSGVYAVRVENISARPNLTDSDENLKQMILQAQKMAAYRSSEALKKAAEIKDYRSKFY